ncbi:MAG TPA: YCF48-related protein [Casimicrobiaceae bacterium]|nr:YCF48-related protein [Casimicrobiaceae bacterium]
MKASTTLRMALATALVLSLAAPAIGAGFTDVLDTPAQISPLAAKSMLQSVARAGNRLVAVGQRGHIVVSNDNGTTWKQSPAPVSSDLTAVFFVDDRQGWAVGHDGVVLHSGDGGDTWQLQLDGRKANDLLVAAMERKLASEPASANAKAFAAEAQRYKEQGADKPFLDVWFSDAKVGYAVGAFNLIFRTTDGGATWETWFDKTENPKFFNLYAIRPVAGELYIAGEGGLVLKLDPASQRFVALTVPYNGSFFGVAGAGSAVLVFGLRGNVYRSEDAGKTWTKADAGLPAAIVGAAQGDGGAVLLADGGGRIASSADGGRTFSKVALKNPTPVTGFAPIGNDRFVLVGPRGATVTETAAR